MANITITTLKYAKPDSLQYRGFYAQQRRKKRKASMGDGLYVLNNGDTYILSDNSKYILEGQ